MNCICGHAKHDGLCDACPCFKYRPRIITSDDVVKMVDAEWSRMMRLYYMTSATERVQ